MKNICKYKDCKRPIRSMGLCVSHHRRYTGKSNLSMDSPIKGGKSSIEEKLKNFSKLDKKTGCIIWLGSKRKKDRNCYGCIRVNKKTYAVHRIAYEKYVGKIPEGMLVCHKCDNPKCINPKHLFLGNPKDNMDDKVRKNRQAKGEKVNTSKLTKNKVLEIKERNESGENYESLSRCFNVTAVAIRYICIKRNWKHIKTNREKFIELISK